MSTEGPVEQGDRADRGHDIAPDVTVGVTPEVDPAGECEHDQEHGDTRGEGIEGDAPVGRTVSSPECAELLFRRELLINEALRVELVDGDENESRVQHGHHVQTDHRGHAEAEETEESGIEIGWDSEIGLGDHGEACDEGGEVADRLELLGLLVNSSACVIDGPPPVVEPSLGQ